MHQQAIRRSLDELRAIQGQRRARRTTRTRRPRRSIAGPLLTAAFWMLVGAVMVGTALRVESWPALWGGA